MPAKILKFRKRKPLTVEPKKGRSIVEIDQTAKLVRKSLTRQELRQIKEELATPLPPEEDEGT